MDNRLIAYTSSRREIDGEERVFRNRVGVAFPHKRADGYTILIDDNLGVRGEIVLFPPFDDTRNPRPERSQRQSAPAPESGNGLEDFDDDIPF